MKIDKDKIFKEEIIGKGTFSTVYRVTSPELPGETLIMKQIDKKKTDHTRLQRELEVLNTLKKDCEKYTTCLVDVTSDDK